MGAAFPKYHELICDDYTPDFIAGPTPCALPSVQTATKARLEAGGTFFRSVEDGGTADVNQIKLQCIVTPITIDVPAGEVWSSVDFIITNPDNVVTNIPTFTQKIDVSGSPNVCVYNGFAHLRAALTSNGVVNMPVDDSAIAGAGSGWKQIDDEGFCMLTTFGPTNMAGSLPSTPASPTGRTGPTFTLLHVGDIEEGAKGEITIAVNRLSEWDGTKWIGHPSDLFEPAYDANGDVIAPHPDCPNPTPI